MAVGTGSESAIAEALLAHWDYAVILTPSSLPITSNTINRARHIFVVRAAYGRATDAVWVFEDADFGIQAARAAGMDAGMFACCE